MPYCIPRRAERSLTSYARPVSNASGLPSFGPLTVLSGTRLELLPTLALAVTAGLYLYGVSRLTGRGDRWPLLRTLSFLLGGLGTVAVACCPPDA